MLLFNRHVEEIEASGVTSYTRSPLQALRFFLPLLKPHCARVLLICLLDLVTIVLEFIPPIFGTLLIDQAFPNRDLWFAVSLAGAFVLSQLGIQGIVAYRNFLSMTLEVRLGFDLRQLMYIQLQRLSISFTESTPVGLRVFRSRWDTGYVASVMAKLFPTLTRFIEFALVLLAITYIDPFITWIALAFYIPWTILQFWITSIYRVWDRRRFQASELRDAGVLQGVTSFALIKSFGRIKHELDKHASRSIKTQRLANNNYLIWWVYDMAVLRLVPYLRRGVTTFLLYRKVIAGEITLGQTIPMLAYLEKQGEPIQKLVDFVNELRRSMVPAERLMQTLEIRSAVPEPTIPIVINSFTGRFLLENVSFAYPGYPDVLRNITLKINPGDRIAIVGPSGAGKSTLLSLLVRLHDPTRGVVRADDVDLRTANMHRLMQQIAVVSQSTFIFGGTLADNLQYGNREATADEMLQALTEVELDQWLSTLPDGLQTDLESGSALSVGQAQRIGIARTLLCQPSLFILDEPTSALDTETERSVMAVLDRVTKLKTTLLITHRLNTIRSFENIVVLEAGEIVQQGTFEELRLAPGLFKNMLDSYYKTESRNP